MLLQLLISAQSAERQIFKQCWEIIQILEEIHELRDFKAQYKRAIHISCQNRKGFTEEVEQGREQRGHSKQREYRMNEDSAVSRAMMLLEG